MTTPPNVPCLSQMVTPTTQSPATLRSDLTLMALSLPEFAAQIHALVEHSRQLEHVLKFYANPENYDGFGAVDGGAAARSVLKHHLN